LTLCPSLASTSVGFRRDNSQKAQIHSRSFTHIFPTNAACFEMRNGNDKQKDSLASASLPWK